MPRRAINNSTSCCSMILSVASCTRLPGSPSANTCSMIRCLHVSECANGRWYHRLMASAILTLCLAVVAKPLNVLSRHMTRPPPNLLFDVSFGWHLVGQWVCDVDIAIAIRNRGVAPGRLLGSVIYGLMRYVPTMRRTRGTTYGTSSGVREGENIEK